MPIQIIIFLTKNRLFSAEINNDGKADAISIKGNHDIKCDNATDVDELFECLIDAFSIDSFADENFDIVIVDCGGDKKIISYLNAKCSDATKLSIISIEKLLPLLTWNKKPLESGEEVVVAFADACYKVACDKKKVVRFTGKARKGKETVTLELDDFGCLYCFNVENMQGGVVDTTALQEKDDVIEKLEEENDKLMRILNEKENALVVALATAKDAEKKIAKLNAAIEIWKEKFPEPTDGTIQMLEIVKSYKQKLRNLPNSGGLFGAILTNRNWEFCTKESISKNKMNGSINALRQVTGGSIDGNDFIALLTAPDAETKMILFTTKGIFFDNARTCIAACWELPKPGYLSWSSIDSFAPGGWEIYINVFGKPQMKFELAVGMENLSTQIAKMANELKDVDI